VNEPGFLVFQAFSQSASESEGLYPIELKTDRPQSMYNSGRTSHDLICFQVKRP
jgi:hypothetical protein